MNTILITGGSRGIGAATALLAAKEGYAVAVNYHNNTRAAEGVVAQINKEGGTALSIQADISKENEVERLFRETHKKLGNIDVLVNNAGVLEQQMKFELMSLERLNRIFQTNIIGSWLCAREAVKYMAASKGGRGGAIINVSSIASKSGAPHEYIDYAVSKGAIDTFTTGLSKEIAGEGIRVNAVRPACIYTDIHSDGGEPERVNRIKDHIPLKRGGYPNEVAEAILWLASEKSSYCTGTFIDISGGL